MAFFETFSGDEEELLGQSTLLVEKIHGKLVSLGCGSETSVRALIAVRNLASHNAAAVIDSLLAEQSLPFDDAVVRLLLFSRL